MSPSMTRSSGPTGFGDQAGFPGAGEDIRFKQDTLPVRSARISGKFWLSERISSNVDQADI